jgi:ribonuclease D
MRADEIKSIAPLSPFRRFLKWLGFAEPASKTNPQKPDSLKKADPDQNRRTDRFSRKKSSKLPPKSSSEKRPQRAPSQIPNTPALHAEMITEQPALLALCENIAKHPKIALDTEADSLHCYFEKLCLIQISTPDAHFLVDPLASLDLSPLFEALKGKVVIIHGCDYDLRLLRKAGWTDPKNVFDTGVAARLIGLREFGLAALLHHHFGLVLAKASQKANWAIRPLPPQMLDYAVNDTAHLLALADLLEQQLTKLGRTEWFVQSCDRLIRNSAIVRERDPDTLWRISGHSDLSQRGMAILRTLWTWRESEAQSVDRPTFHILNNDSLLEASHRLDQNGQFEPRNLRGSRLERFQQAAREALALPSTDWPKSLRKPRPKPIPDYEERFRQFRDRRDKSASKFSLDPTLIAPKAILEALARQDPDVLDSLLPWQRTALGVQDTPPAATEASDAPQAP